MGGTDSRPDDNTPPCEVRPPRASPSSESEASGCVIAAGVLVQTRNGMIRADILAAMRPIPDVWTDSGWATVTVDQLGDAPIMCVHLSDGSSLECTAGASWPITPPHNETPVSRTRISPRLDSASAPQERLLGGPSELKRSATEPRSAWAPKPTSELVPGDRITPYPALPAVELGSSGLSIEDARALGMTIGKKAIARGVRPQPRAVALSNDEARAFVEGWSDSQNGCLSGGEALVVELQALLRRAGVNRTLLEKHPRQSASLYIDDREAWTASTRRLWTRRLRTAIQTVVDVETLKDRQPVYRLTTPTPAIVAIGNTTLASV